VFVLELFPKDSEELLASFPLEGLVLAEAREIFRVPDPEDPMYDVWDVEEGMVTRLQPYTDHKIRLDQYDYQFTWQEYWDASHS
jgi:hypothetical protein